MTKVLHKKKKKNVIYHLSMTYDKHNKNYRLIT